MKQRISIFICVFGLLLAVALTGCRKQPAPMAPSTTVRPTTVPTTQATTRATVPETTGVPTMETEPRETTEYGTPETTIDRGNGPLEDTQSTNPQQTRR